MGDLGDLGNFLKEGSLADLSWLDVDEVEYRKQDTLPKQNLDTKPDLEALWAHEDKPSTTYLEPNQAAAPRTMGDLSQVHGPLRAKPEDIMRTARLLVMMTTNPGKIASSLKGAYDADSLAGARTALAGVFAERGLLGPYYISARDFPNCAKGGSKDAAFVKRYASQARFVLAKAACLDCTQCHKHGEISTCATFDKQIEIAIPYTPAMAERVEQAQRAKGKAVQASSASSKERIRRALLAADVPSERLVQIKPRDNMVRLLQTAAPVTPVVLPQDLSRERRAATAAVDDAFREGRVSMQVAQKLYRGVAASQDPVLLQQITEYAGRSQRDQTSGRLGVQTSFRGTASSHITSSITRRNIVLTARMYLNEGLYGKQLATLLGKKFDPRDIQAAREDLLPVLAEQGLQGIFYIDPTVHADYGNCAEAARLHRTRLVKYAKVGPKCESCVHQAKPGWCSVLAKQLVVEPPYEDKAAQQKAVLASGDATTVSYADLVNNGHRAMLEYELTQREMAVEVDAPRTASSVNIEFNRQGVKL